MRMDTRGEGTGRSEMTTARELEDKQLWDFENMMLNIDQKSWREKEGLFDLANVSIRDKEEFLRMKENVSRQKERCFRKMEALLRRKEKRLEEVLLKFGENCIAGSSSGSEGPSAQQLLPGLPNEITLGAISTKLSWREVHVLKSASRGWYSAIRNYFVYDARVHSHLTETFVLVQYSQGFLALRSLRENSRFELPQIPYDDRRMIGRSTHPCVAVDGRVFVLGGVFNGPSDKVYMLDLAGRRSWTQCASMHTARSSFGCGVMNGKIYVFGGSCFERNICESEVYDPKENTWSLITPILALRSHLKVVIVGEEFFLYDGVIDDGDGMKGASFLEIYHPVSGLLRKVDGWRTVDRFSPGGWRTVNPFALAPQGEIFAFKRKVYSMDLYRMQVYNYDENSWTQVCRNSFTPVDSVPYVNFRASVVLALEDNLLAFGVLTTMFDFSSLDRTCVFRSIGFDTGKEELEWIEERGWALDKMICSMYPVHL